MEIIKRLVSVEKYSLKCPYAMAPVGICVHNTSNDASAANEIAYMTGNNDATSFHYAIDDKEIVQGIPDKRNAFHAGDGSFGDGNRKYIGIEICYSKSGGERFIQAEKNAAAFIASKLKEYGWDISHVKKHQDFSGKYCPHRTLDMGWQRFLDMIKAELHDKEEEEMTKEEIQKLVAEEVKKALESSKEKVYHYWKDLPKWALRPMYAAYKAKLFVGSSPSNLNVTYNMIRTVVYDARLARLIGVINFKDDAEDETKADILKELGIE